MLGYDKVFMPPYLNKCCIQTVSQAPTSINVEKVILLEKSSNLNYVHKAVQYEWSFSSWMLPSSSWPVHPEVSGPGGSYSWGVSQLAKHACIWYFNRANGKNSAVLVPSSHGGERRTEGKTVSKEVVVACVYYSHFLIWCILGKGSVLQHTGSRYRQAWPALLTLWAEYQCVGVPKNHRTHTSRSPWALRAALQSRDESDELFQVRLPCIFQQLGLSVTSKAMEW